MKRLLLSFLTAGALMPAALAATASATPVLHTAIAGGAAGTVPGVVQISTPTQYCTGALIAPTVVLTAAHCVSDVRRPATIKVHTPDHRQTLTVSRFVTAPGFDATTHVNDAAVLILKTSARGQTLPVLATEPVTGTGAKITGYGQHTYTSSVANVAYEASTTIGSFSACQRTWAKFGSAIPSSDMCAQNVSNAQTTLTRGDSGGPLLVKSSAGGWAIAGINDLVLIPNDVYTGQIPQAFTRVSAIHGWIQSQIG